MLTDGVRIVRAGELRPTPWPNGRGVTRDVERRLGPNGQVSWLLSVADLTEDAPFSHFPGLDRAFTLIEGGPVELSVDGGGWLGCERLVPVWFPGDRPTEARVGARSRAFNVFVERGRLAANVFAGIYARGQSIQIPSGMVAVHCMAGSAGFEGGELAAGDTLLGSEPAGLRAGSASATLISVGLAGR